MPETAVIRVLIADDHPVYRLGLRRILEMDPGLVVLAEAADGREAIALTRTHRPDVLLLDVAMPTVSGLDALVALGNECSLTRIVLLTAAIEPQEALRALRLGASGVLMKTSAADQIFKCIRTVIAGHYWIGGDALQCLVESLAKGPLAVATDTAPRLFGLTARELDVVALVSTGASNRDIARQLGLSEETVKHHLSKIFDKTGQSSRVELALFATHAGLVPRD